MKYLNMLFKKLFSVYKKLINYLIFNNDFNGNEILSNINYSKNQSHEKIDLKNIIHINTFDKIGGAALLANSLCKELIKRGFNSKLLVHKKYYKDDCSVVINRSKTIKQLFYNLFQIKNNWGDFYELSSLKIPDLDLVKKSNIIHLHNIHGGYFNPLLLSQLTSIKPVIWTLHDTQELIYPCDNYKNCYLWINNCENCNLIKNKYFDSKYYKIWRKKKKIIESSNLTIVCPSKWLKNQVENSIFKGHTIELIYNGIDTTIFNINKLITRNDLNLPKDKFIILFIAHGGINNPSKGGNYLKKIYSLLKHKNDIFFVSIGAEKPSRIDENWIELGYINSKRKLALYYTLSDLFVYPSMNDVFGLVVAESIACGTPVVSFETGGIPEIVEHMKTGYIVPQGNIDLLYNGIMMYYNNRYLLDNVKINGPLTISKKFSIKTMTDNYIKLYLKTVNNRI